MSVTSTCHMLDPSTYDYRTYGSFTDHLNKNYRGKVKGVGELRSEFLCHVGLGMKK